MSEEEIIGRLLDIEQELEEIKRVLRMEEPFEPMDEYIYEVTDQLQREEEHGS